MKLVMQTSTESRSPCVVPQPKWPIPTMQHLDPFLALLELLLPWHVTLGTVLVVMSFVELMVFGPVW